MAKSSSRLVCATLFAFDEKGVPNVWFIYSRGFSINHRNKELFRCYQSEQSILVLCLFSFSQIELGGKKANILGIFCLLLIQIKSLRTTGPMLSHPLPSRPAHNERFFNFTNQSNRNRLIRRAFCITKRKAESRLNEGKRKRKKDFDPFFILSIFSLLLLRRMINPFLININDGRTAERIKNFCLTEQQTRRSFLSASLFSSPGIIKTFGLARFPFAFPRKTRSPESESEKFSKLVCKYM